MKRTTTNFWLDLVSFFVMVGLALTGGITHYVLPAGTGNWNTLFGLGRHDFGKIHFYLAFTAVLLLAIHVALHWSWICCFIAKGLGREQPSRRTQMLAGIALLATIGLLLVVGLGWAASRVEEKTREAPGYGKNRWLGKDATSAVPDEIQIEPTRPSAPTVEPQLAEPQPRMHRGTLDKSEEDCAEGMAINRQSTLQEAAVAAGMTVDAFLNGLKVTVPADPQERLGKLKRQFGFSIHDVRILVCRKLDGAAHEGDKP
jgi:hypothetical protein